VCWAEPIRASFAYILPSGSRSSTLLKVKSFQDDEVLIIGYADGKGKYKGMVGALEVKLKNGKKFSVGSGFAVTPLCLHVSYN